MDDCVRLLVVTFPSQGNINPGLQFAKRLVEKGVQVTFVTAFSYINGMTKSSAATPQGLTFSGFSDGYDEGNGHLWTNNEDADRYIKELKIRGSEAIAKLITSAAERGQPFIHVVYTTIASWVGEVARALHVPSTLLWVQPATIFGIYYFYFHGYGESIGKNMNDPSWPIELPGLPLLTGSDLPSFLLPSNTFDFGRPLYKGHFDVLDTETNPKVLINSFDALEPGALRAIEKLNMVAIGPLIPSAFLDGKNPSDSSTGGDLFEWLNSKPSESVVYVAFGSSVSTTKQQMEEIELGLLECGRPFLWVVRETEDGKLSCKEELNQQGLIVSWCSQVEVLSHPSVGCFCDSLRVEFVIGELCFWGSGGGFPAVGRPSDEWKTYRGCLENRDKSDKK